LQHLRSARSCAARAIALFREEIDRVLALIGCRGISVLNADYLA
jgi:isopentenyl diphosphate isomerase/L-lactate dehydrogenase-like FMN-dependent dehydrogenase